MAHSVLLFLTWKTRDSQPLIDEHVADQLLRLLPGLALTENTRLIEVAIVPTHVHAVVVPALRLDIPAIVQRLKGASARLVNRGRESGRPLRWDRGYDVRSIGRRSLPMVRSYFDIQAQKHGFPWVVRYSLDPYRDELREPGAGLGASFTTRG